MLLSKNVMSIDSKEIFDEAVKDFDNGLFNRAIVGFYKIIEKKEDYVLSEVAKEFIFEAHQKSALKYISEEIYGKALDEIKKSEEIGHSSKINNFLRGLIYNNLGEFSKSYSIFKELYENSGKAVEGISICYAIILLNIGFLEEAEHVLDETEDIPPYSSRINYLKSILNFRLANYDNVEKLLINSLNLRKPNVEAEKALIAFKLYSGKYEEAAVLIENIFDFLKDFDKLDFLIPILFLSKYFQIRFSNKSILEYLKENSNNVKISEKSLEKWIDNEFYRTLSISLDFLPNLIPPQDSIRNSWFRLSLINFYKGLIDRGMRNFMIFFNLGREYQRLRKRKEAITYLEMSVKLNPDYISAKISLAFAYKYIGEKEKAIPIFEEIIESFNNEVEINFKSNKFLTEIEGYTDNKKLLQKELSIYFLAIKTNPGFADLYYNVGRIYYHLDDPPKAYEYFEKAYKLNPEFTRAKIGMAFALIQLNRVGEASNILNEVKNEKSLFERIAYNLFLLYKEIGDKKNMEKYREILKKTSLKEMVD